MWMIELTTKTITAESRMGNHNAVMETIVPPSLLSLHGRAAEDPPKPMPDGMRSQPTTMALTAVFFVRIFLSPKGQFPKLWDQDRARRVRPPEACSYRHCFRLRSARFGAGHVVWCP